MSTFLFRCPVTGYRVQGFIADNPASCDETVYEPLTCAVCGGTHLVNPKTGKLLGAGDKDSTRQARESDTGHGPLGLDHTDRIPE